MDNGELRSEAIHLAWTPPASEAWYQTVRHLYHALGVELLRLENERMAAQHRVDNP